MRKPPPVPKTETRQWRDWKGVNVTDSRTGIDDTDLAWMENAMSIGRGALQILPREGTSIASVPNGIGTLWGIALNGLPLFIAICMDGSIQAIRVPSGTIVQVAAPGSVGVTCQVTVWQGTQVLFVDRTAGYSSWNGTTYTVRDATLDGQSVAVFEGRVWIGNNRTITYSAPNSFTDFTVASGGGNVTITDEAFSGNIRALISSLEQLWIIGDSAINAIANVQSVTLSGSPPTTTTSFSNTNIVSNIGSPFPASVIGYFRALVFATNIGVYALSGVTPQQISDKVNQLPVGGVIGPVRDLPSAVGAIFNQLAVMFLVPYAGFESLAGPPPVPLIVGFVQGKWFFGYQGPLRWITSLVYLGEPQVWGTDGSRIYPLFSAPDTTLVRYKIKSKLYDFGIAPTMKMLMKLGLEWRPLLPGSIPVEPEPSDIMATGLAASPEIELSLSEDSGETWDSTAIAFNPAAGEVVWAIEYLGNDILLIGIENTVNAQTTPSIFRSVDRGVTWDGGQTLPLGITGLVTIYVIRRIGLDGVVLAGGTAADAIGPVLLRSVNRGVTWTRVAVADIVNTSSTSAAYQIRDILDLGNGVVVIGLGGRSGVSDVQWRLSTDSGATFPIETTLIDANPGDVPPAPWQMALSDDGHIISVGDRDSAGDNGIWRGERVPPTGTPTDIEWSRVLTTAL